MLNNCKNCVYRNYNTQTCTILNNVPIGEGNFHCPFHQTEFIKCGICGKTITIQPIFMYSAKQEKHIAVCQSCVSTTGTCRTCERASACAFAADTTIPNFIVETKQIGPVTQQFQVKNPEKIRLYCKNGKCPCFDEILGCLKENGCCGKYKEGF